MILILRMAKF